MIHRFFKYIFLLLFSLTSFGFLMAQESSVTDLSIDHDDIMLSQTVVMKKGSYQITDLNNNGVITIKTSNITVDFSGSELIGASPETTADKYQGIGILLEGCNNVTIKNGIIRGFKVGILVRGCKNIVISSNNMSCNFRQRLQSTPKAEIESDWLWPHNNDKNEWRENYGAGIAIEDSSDVVIRDNIGQKQQNGIILSRCTKCSIYDNDMSFNSGWGLAMWRSSDNRISHNRFDYCVRGYSHNIYARGQDSTGILIFEQCSNNIFAYNSATHGGDGFFLYAGNETLKNTGEGGCNNNLLFKNDFSHAVANGIEATFSKDNRFIENTLNECHYGVWAGYSYQNQIIGNEIKDSLYAGVAIEHGHHNTIEGNLFKNNPADILLWWDPDTDLLESIYGKKQNTNSEYYTIERNTFSSSKVCLKLIKTSHVVFSENEIRDIPQPIVLKDECGDLEIKSNNLYLSDESAKSLISAVASLSVHIGQNFWNMSQERLLTIINSTGIELKAKIEPCLEKATNIEVDRWKRSVPFPEVEGKLDTFIPSGTARGRKTIVVDEWGPFDFKETKLFPKFVSDWKKADFNLLGPSQEFTVTQITGNIDISPDKGRVPATLLVTPSSKAMPQALLPFNFCVKIDDAKELLKGSGFILNAVWKVSFYQWTKDPQDPANWKETVSCKPLYETQTDALNFIWWSRKPFPDVPADQFATVASTSIYLPAGSYQFYSVSDDGIRVFVDDRAVLENWTRHVPTQDTVDVCLTDGIHQIRVEHFEWDGYAQLQLWILPSGQGK